MVVLSGKNLGERHRELNCKVAEVIANKVKFEDINIEEDVSDIDTLFKIDIASEYKNIDYIIEVLKSGDSLYISKALKCLWLYHDKNSYIINPEYLHVHIFPSMSMKMKKKMLTTLSVHIQHNDRAEIFFIYCIKNLLPNIALKFLIFSSEEFKMNVLKNQYWLKCYPYTIMETNIHNFVGNSFMLATTCIEMYNGWERYNIIYSLRYLYAISNEKYLDLVEKYEKCDLEEPIALKRLGIRISKDIMLKHKSRVLENPLLYVNKLNKNMLIKYTSKCEAKKYLNCLMPQCVKTFWQINFCRSYDYLLQLIPINEQFECMKQMFTEKYTGEAFEMTRYFYNLEYYNLMSVDMRELWALRLIDEQKEILGVGNDYKWYKFVNIDKALIEINKIIMVTPDSNKRRCLVNILVEAARDQKDLIKVLVYYYDRHVNETETDKKNFIDNVLSKHNVFEFDIECWQALNKLFYSLDIYSVGRFSDKDYMAVAVVCHILHKIDLPEALLHFVDLDVNYSYFSLLLKKLCKEKSDIVLQYLIKLFVDKLKPFEQDPYNEKLREKLQEYARNIINLLSCFQADDKECPEIVKKFMNIHYPKAEKKKIITPKDILYFIKTDATLAVDVLGHSELNISKYPNVLKNTLRKLKVYFHNDVAQEYIKFLDHMIHESLDDYASRKKITAAIFGIFHLGDESFKVSLMEKYHPSQPKIDHSIINRKLLCIQEAICRFVGYSRPPVPLKIVLQYVKGDYVNYCLPMFNMYLANLPLPLVMKFTENIIDAPLSLHKHGLRLAFACYTSESLKNLVLSSWKKSKNVSLRKIIYKSLFNKLTMQTSLIDDEEHAKMYEVLKLLTSDLHQDDHEDLFELILSCRHLSHKFIGDYLQTAWQMVIKLPKKQVNIDRQIQIIDCIKTNIDLLQRDFVRKNIIDEHVNEVLEHRLLHPDELHKFQKQWNSKWNLTASFIVNYGDNDELNESLALVSKILNKCVEMWNDKYNETFIFQNCYFDFLACVENKIRDVWYNDLKVSRSIPVFKHILDIFQEALPLKEIYLIVWNLKLIIFILTSLNVTNTIFNEREEKLKPLSREQIFCENIANHIQNFVQQLVANHQFYGVYISEIARLLKCKLPNLENMENLYIIVCQSLANIGLKETHLLTLIILPLPADVPEEMKEMHSKILKKIQAFDNEEIQSYLYLKFFSTYTPMFACELLHN